MNGTLYIVGTPIGNLEDITLRALRILKEVSLIACEDTRETQKLLEHYQIRKPLVSYHEFNEQKRSRELVEKLKRGENIALVSDAGMPGISDPGFRVISLAIKENIDIVPIPGPSSILTALVVSGLPTHRFLFEGFIPEKSTARKKFFYSMKNEERTMVFFESVKRLEKTLKEIFEILGNRKICIARELTKKFETLYRGHVKEIIEALSFDCLKGELVLVLEGNSKEESYDDIRIEDHIDQIMNTMKISKKEAIKIVAQLRGIKKREVYKRELIQENRN